MPELPAKVQMVPVGRYWKLPVPSAGASKPASPRLWVPPMLKGPLKMEVDENSKSAVAVMFSPAASVVGRVKLKLALPLASVVAVVCPMNVSPW